MFADVITRLNHDQKTELYRSEVTPQLSERLDEWLPSLDGSPSG